MALPIAFGVDLIAATLLSADHVAAIVGAIGWRSTLPAALGVGVLGWPFYSGFIAHTQGQLGSIGVRDAVVLVVLVGIALGAAAMGTVLRQRDVYAAGPDSVHVVEVMSGVPLPVPRPSGSNAREDR
jgi:hypothetical protein